MVLHSQLPIVLNCQLSQNHYCIHAITVDIYSMPKIVIQTSPIFEVPVAGLVSHLSSFLGKNKMDRPFTRQINGLGFTTITKISFCPFFLLKKLILQATFSKDGDIRVVPCPPRATHPYNISTLNGYSNFVPHSWFLQLVRVPTAPFITVIWWLTQEICAVDCDLLPVAFIIFESI